MSQEWGRADAAGTWPRPKPVWTLALLVVAISSGAVIGAYRYSTAWTQLHAVLREWIYRDQTLSDLAMPTLWGSLAVFVVGLFVTIPKDIARSRARRHGRRLKGPELVTAATLNRHTRADGIGFVQTSNV